MGRDRNMWEVTWECLEFSLKMHVGMGCCFFVHMPWLSVVQSVLHDTDVFP